MFLDQFNDDQKRSFLALATRMILADGDVAPEEDGELDKIRDVLGADVIAPPEEVFGSTNGAVFSDRAVQVIAVFEILLLAHADQHMHIDESSVLAEISGALKINEADGEALSSLAQRLIASPGDEGVRGEVEALMTPS